MDISRPCQPEKLIPLLPWPGFDPSFAGHNDRRAITSEWTRLRLKPLSHQGWLSHYGYILCCEYIITHDAFINYRRCGDYLMDECGTLKCENAAICEKVAKCEKNSTLNVKFDAICEKITLNVKKWGSLNVSNISTLNVLKSTLYVQTLFWRYLWKSNFLIENLILMPS